MRSLFFFLISCNLVGSDPVKKISSLSATTDITFNFYFDNEALKKKYEHWFQDSIVFPQESEISSSENSNSEVPSPNNSTQNEENSPEGEKVSLDIIAKKYLSQIINSLGFHTFTESSIHLTFDIFTNQDTSISDNQLASFIAKQQGSSDFSSPNLNIYIFVFEKAQFNGNLSSQVLGRSELYQTGMFLFESVLNTHRNNSDLKTEDSLAQIIPVLNTVLHEFGHLVGTLSCSEKPSSDGTSHCNFPSCIMATSNNGMTPNKSDSLKKKYEELLNLIKQNKFDEITLSFCRDNCQSCLLGKLNP